MKIILAIFLLLQANASFAKVETFQFATPQMEEDYLVLSQQLRCLVCQNQNLADSNAELAQDLRLQVYEKLQAGSSRQQIVDYMVARYGDFVMYKPPVKSTTYLLWFGPLLLFVLAFIIVFVFMRKQQKESVEISTQAQQKAHSLLDE